jgi:hypothetical protein
MKTEQQYKKELADTVSELKELKEYRTDLEEADKDFKAGKLSLIEYNFKIEQTQSRLRIYTRRTR